MDDTKIVALAKPITFGNTEYTQIELREPTAGEVEKSSRTAGVASMILLISLVSGIPRGGIENLPMRKFTECSDFLGQFCATPLATGET